MTAVSLGYGAEFWIDNSSGVLTQCGEILGVPLPNEQVEEVEATHMASPNRTREFIAGLIDLGEASFDMNYIPGSASDILLREAKDSGENRDYKVVLTETDGSQWKIEGQCFIKGYERAAPIDDRKTVSVTVRFSGAVTEAAV
jgi:predicted secreted protein